MITVTLRYTHNKPFNLPHPLSDIWAVNAFTPTADIELTHKLKYTAKTYIILIPNYNQPSVDNVD